jgi:AraC-like DNA-binding protein
VLCFNDPTMKPPPNLRRNVPEGDRRRHAPHSRRGNRVGSRRRGLSADFFSSSPPIYKSGGRTWLIDTQRPQRRAAAEGKIEVHALSHGHYLGKVLDPRLLPGISSIGYWDAVGEQNWGLEPHRNEGVEFVFLETGGMVFTVDGRRHRLRAGDLTITRPWQLHRLGDPHIGPGRLHWFIVDVGVRRPHQDWRWPPWISLIREDLEELTARLRQNERPVWRGTPQLQHDFREIAESLRANRGRSHISRIVVHLNHLFLNILDALRAQDARRDPALTTEERTIALFLADLKANPATLAQPWTLVKMAARCGVGVTTFAKYCRRITNTSAMKVLARCRCEQAARRIRREPAASMTDIAFDCGFSSSQYFASQFRRRFGCSPTAYRARD